LSLISDYKTPAVGVCISIKQKSRQTSRCFLQQIPTSFSGCRKRFTQWWQASQLEVDGDAVGNSDDAGGVTLCGPEPPILREVDRQE